MQPSEQNATRARCTTRVGLIGGMSWRSTALYYERLNLALEQREGRHRSFDGVIWNLDYAVLYAAAEANDWPAIEVMLCTAGSGLAQAGCSLIVMTAVTAHLFADSVAQVSGRPVPHILSGAARELDRLGVGKAGVLGTASSCAAPFLRERLGADSRELLLLDPARQQEIDSLIQGVLTTGADAASARPALTGAVLHLRGRGAEAVVLACTELPLLLPIESAGIPVIDSVALHVDHVCKLITSETDAG